MPTREHIQDAIQVEADTAEQALAIVRERLGDDAEIIEARKVHRGGWKGFFALERVELTARPRVGAVPAAATPPAPPAPPVGPAATDGATADPASVRRQFEEEEKRDRADFDRMLRRLLEPEPDTATSATARPTPPDPAPAAHAPASAEPPRAEPPLAEPSLAEPVLPEPPRPAAPRRVSAAPSAGPVSPGVAWSCAELEALRLPAPLVDACADLDPADDAAWVSAIADVVGPWCRPLPSGAPAYVGPRVAGFARSLGVPTVRLGAATALAGPVALEAPDTSEGRAWAVRLAGDRWLHVVAGGRRWHGFMFEDALAVSWLGDDQLPLALTLASRMGLVLGHGHCRGTRQFVRATPVDVALGIRALLPRT